MKKRDCQRSMKSIVLREECFKDESEKLKMEFNLWNVISLFLVFLYVQAEKNVYFHPLLSMLLTALTSSADCYKLNHVYPTDPRTSD